jgi:hypothetical protein
VALKCLANKNSEEKEFKGKSNVVKLVISIEAN